MSALFDELTRITKLHAYASTGNKEFLKDMPPMDRVTEHLLQTPDRPANPPELPQQEFDESDDALMRELCGKRLAKPIQSLLERLSDSSFTGPVRDEICALRDAVKAEFHDL